MNNIIESSNDSIMQQDLEEIAKDNLPIEKIAGRTVLVTGASGLIGSQIVKALACINRLKNTNIRILAFVRNEEKAKKVFADLLEREDVKLVLGDINSAISIEEDVDYIIHGASATSSKYFVSNPVETIKTAMDGTTNILEFAKEKSIKGMVYLSSLEVY